MDFGQQVLSSRCSKCGRLTCPRCQDRACLSCGTSYSDRLNVDMIAEYGVCVSCGMMLTQKYKVDSMPKQDESRETA